MKVKAREITLPTTSRMCRTETLVLRTMTRNAMVRQAVSTKAVFTQILILTPDQCSCAIMNKIYPSLKGDPSLPPQLLHSRPECFRRSFMNRGPLILPRIREERLVEIFRQVLSIHVSHRPHCANHAPESTVFFFFFFFFFFEEFIFRLQLVEKRRSCCINRHI